jgi:SPP1 gp7 family putative phage head morphogenesis protein
MAIDPTEISQVRYNMERRAMNAYANRSDIREGLLDASFRHYLNEIESKINNYYLRYANREGISIQEARKRADAMDVQSFATRARKAVQDKDFSHKTNEWLKVYNLKMRVSREELLKYNIQLELYKLNKEQEHIITTGMDEEYRKEIERQTGILGNSVPSNIGERVEDLIDADFYGNSFSEKIWGANGKYDLIERKVFETLGDIQGNIGDYRSGVAKLMETFDVSKSDAYRLMRTEARRMNATASMDMYKEEGFTHYIYTAEPDACLICASLDNTAIPIGEEVPGYNYPTMHPNCRCSSYGVIRMIRRNTGTSNINDHNERYGDYSTALKDLEDVINGDITDHSQLRNKSREYAMS